MSEYFGACPTCHKTDGYVNVGNDHWFICKQHRAKWCIGANLFSSAMEESDEEKRREYEELGLDTYTAVENPYYGVNDYSDDEAGYQEQYFPDDISDELDMIVPASKTVRAK